MSREKISEMVVTLFEAKLNNYTPLKVDIWVKILEKTGIPLDMLSVAFDKAILTENTFPEPANIIAMCKPDFKSEAEENWEYLVWHISKRGCGVSLPEGRLREMIKTMGGLDKFGEMDDTAFSFARKEFVSRWAEKRDKEFTQKVSVGEIGNEGRDKIGN
jgi:hypothetical protein